MSQEPYDAQSHMAESLERIADALETEATLEARVLKLERKAVTKELKRLRARKKPAGDGFWKVRRCRACGAHSHAKDWEGPEHHLVCPHCGKSDHGPVEEIGTVMDVPLAEVKLRDDVARLERDAWEAAGVYEHSPNPLLEDGMQLEEITLKDGGMCNLREVKTEDDVRRTLTLLGASGEVIERAARQARDAEDKETMGFFGGDPDAHLEGLTDVELLEELERLLLKAAAKPGALVHPAPLDAVQSELRRRKLLRRALAPVESGAVKDARLRVAKAGARLIELVTLRGLGPLGNLSEFDRKDEEFRLALLERDEASMALWNLTGEPFSATLTPEESGEGLKGVKGYEQAERERFERGSGPDNKEEEK